MPVIKVWCLPQVGETKLNELHQELVRAVVEGVPELGITTEKDMTCLFPRDMMEYGLGTEIIVEVTGLYEKPERTEEVCQRLARELTGAVRRQFPDTELIECFVNSFDPAQGFAASRKNEVCATEDKPKLNMAFKRRSRRYLIRSKGDTKLQFPARERIYAIWESIYPNTDFFIGSGVEDPTIGFEAELGPRTTPKKRQEFCDALAAECTFES